MTKLCLGLLLSCLPSIVLAASQKPEEASVASECATWLDHELPQLHSKNIIDLCEVTKGKPLLLVNTASYCGFTKQFSGLEGLYQKYKDKGLVVIGFPSDSFNQESSEEAKTADICYKNFGVTFLMTQAIDVTGGDAHPIFRHLAESTKGPSWNFNKYLIDSSGRVVEHFPSRVKPMGSKLKASLEQVL